MQVDRLPLGVIWDRAYTIREFIGEGGMSCIYEAEVDLDKFDFAKLLSFWEAHCNEVENGHIEAYRKYRYDLWASRDRDEMIAQCQKNNICYPENGICAIKVLAKSGPENGGRFSTEWQKTIGLHHPNLIQVYGGGKFQDIWYCSMELVAAPLEIDHIYKLSLKQKFQIALQAARGLHLLHQKGIIHRDVKLDNLIVYSKSGDLHVKVGDLGVAKDVDIDFTRTHQMLGTPNFMSPEQVKSSKKVDIRTDVYSLGATLYEMIARRPPYEGESIETVLRNLNLGVAPASLREVDSDIPETAENIVTELMSMEIDERPGNMEKVGELLENYIDDGQERKKKLSQTRRNVRVKKKRKRTEAFKMDPAEKALKKKREMYLKLFAILLGPLLLIAYLILGEPNKPSNPGLRPNTHKKRRPRQRQPVKKIEKSIEEIVKKSPKKQWVAPTFEDIKHKGAGSWHLGVDGIWEIHCPEEFQVFSIEKFPKCRDYILRFTVRVESGRLMVGLRNFDSNSLFDYVMESFKVADQVGKSFTFEAKAYHDSLSLRLVGSEEPPITTSNHTQIRPGIMGIVVAPKDGFPASVYIDEIKIQVLSTEN